MYFKFHFASHSLQSILKSILFVEIENEGAPSLSTSLSSMSSLAFNFGKEKMVNTESWKDDEGLADDLRSYVCQNCHRSEILDFMLRDYPRYKWSIATVDRRLRFCELFYIDVDTSVDTVKKL